MQSAGYPVGGTTAPPLYPGAPSSWDSADALIDSLGILDPLKYRVSLWTPTRGSNSPPGLQGFTEMIEVGTRVPVGNGVSYRSAASVGSVCGARNGAFFEMIASVRTDSPQLRFVGFQSQVFHLSFSLGEGVGVVSPARFFCGLSSMSGAPTADDVSTLKRRLTGVAKVDSSPNFQFAIGREGATTSTLIDTGVPFPGVNGELYGLRIAYTRPDPLPLDAVLHSRWVNIRLSLFRFSPGTSGLGSLAPEMVAQYVVPCHPAGTSQNYAMIWGVNDSSTNTCSVSIQRFLAAERIP